MDYKPRPGDFGVVKTSGIIGRLIRIGTTSRWNHTFIYVGDGLIVEANPTGVALSPVTKYPQIAWNLHDKVTKKKRDGIVKHAIDQVGKPYGFLDILVLLFRILGLDLFGSKKFWKPLADKDGYICSELVAECYDTVDFTLINKPNHLVTPGDLAERLVYM